MKVVFKISPSYMIYCFCWSVFTALYRLILILAMPVVLDAILAGVAISTLIISLVGILSLSLLIDIIFSISESSYASKKEVVIKNALQREIYFKTIEIDIQRYDDPGFYNEFILSSSNYGAKALEFIRTIKILLQNMIIWFFTSAFILQYDFVVVLLVLFAFLGGLMINIIFKKACFKMDVITTPLRRQRDYFHRVFYEPRYAKDLRIHDGLKNTLISGYKRANKNLLHVNLKAAPKFTLLYILQHYFFSVFVYKGLILFYLGYRFFVTGDINIAAFFALYNTVAPLSDIFSSIKNSISDFASNSCYFKKIKEFFETQSIFGTEVNKSEMASLEKIEVKDLLFSYMNESKRIIDNISFAINKGDRIAIVGQNGAGKTTLIKLLLRLYDYNEGEIFYNGKCIRSLSLEKYRKGFSTIFQDYKLFAFTVENNVSMTNDSDESLVREALTTAGIGEKIESLEAGIKTYVTSEYENGVDFSGGERQKIAIARNYYKKNKIIILDEPSAALDALSEKKLYQDILDKTDDTVIFISHRLSTTINCKKIFVLDKGKIVEHGTHEELLLADGIYSNMFKIQSQGYLNDIKTIK